MFFLTDTLIFLFAWISAESIGVGGSALAFLASLSIRTVDFAGDMLDMAELPSGSYDENFVISF